MAMEAGEGKRDAGAAAAGGREAGARTDKGGDGSRDEEGRPRALSEVAAKELEEFNVAHEGKIEDYNVLKPIGLWIAARPAPCCCCSSVADAPRVTSRVRAGKGKFSTVYRAVDLASGRTVALKRIQIADIVDEKKRRKTLKEVKLLQNLDHPHIIRYLDSFIDGNDLVIVVEWAAVRGGDGGGGRYALTRARDARAQAGDLKRQIKRAIAKGARFDERVVWKYFVQIAEALQHMHCKRVMHRDLKVGGAARARTPARAHGALLHSPPTSS